jgi:hypothetical protein
MACSMLKVNRDFRGTYRLRSKNKPSRKPARSFACHVLHAGFLFGLFQPEDGGEYSPEMTVDFQPIARCCILEDRIRRNQRCENLRSYI